MRIVAAAVACLFVPFPVWASFADDVHMLVARGDMATADRAVQMARSKVGANPEVAAALSWLARGALAARQLDRADAYAADTQKMALPLLGMRRLDADPWLPVALGAAVEVHASVLAARGEIPEALAYLREQLKTWNGTSLQERISKNINLLSLEGKPAPALEGVSLSSLRGHAVLLFFWAHWCPDCKQEYAILTEIEKEYAARHLAIVAPTQRYGYVAKGEEAGPAVELKYIDEVRHKFYPELLDMPAPVSEENFKNYGASTTPTLVLIDRQGIVRLYHPGAMTLEELRAALNRLG